MMRSTGCSRARGPGRPGSTDSTRICAGSESDMSDHEPQAPSGHEVRISRILDAPRERVFRAWTDPDEIAAWFGPEHMETPRDRVSIDLRVGGSYELTMVPREGRGERTISYEIVELVEPELLVPRSEPMPAAGMNEPESGAREPPRAPRCYRRHRRLDRAAPRPASIWFPWARCPSRTFGTRCRPAAARRPREARSRTGRPRPDVGPAASATGSHPASADPAAGAVRAPAGSGGA